MSAIVTAHDYKTIMYCTPDTKQQLLTQIYAEKMLFTCTA